ncbi:hypothetical protein FA15DRAFT_700797 [Coprinopsis marcescibilis]|uniref:L domain-like protein n=1 Tax=Coprinopsis marcescibilis TaxID=230819 RepID=A0A5C3L7T6_COPMA|nr:hypothetical protein FA15DRAFT_700797 [Coprinopsis marcescibilis]
MNPVCQKRNHVEEGSVTRQLEIQHEISMFSSLKVLDLHKNKIISLPKTIADLSFLNTLDRRSRTNINFYSIFYQQQQVLFAEDGQPHASCIVPPPPRSQAIAEPSRTYTSPFDHRRTTLFPSLHTLNLSFNRLSDGQLSQENLVELLLQTTNHAGPRHLMLRGNKLSELAGFQKLAEMFKGNKDVPEWKLEELDLRNNEIGKLPPELGLLPLDVFLVDRNTFRVPQRRIWERESTKGLLSWLRGRLE